ncbi:hypothetical protein HMPREF0578_1796 [Mobiluncus mulieris 28-1]|nr:hypothetical protein HMPREF0577_1383 [Mobiluncus mulieris ATCC 35243]EEZ90440.1 hypothetical protein HMPREF0578_1796 [Mobiluncus mulieris 28-1]MCU9969390.1 phosphatidylethanolamine-binding protein [Mobiluncus mulieris]MCU9971368.1 phosphatidylethanolamine-binding protein [Mobiluncus mulieris]MCU9973828.1 phosphatidylethanolamine-binding protein [Mobiluncus mulieris]
MPIDKNRDALAKGVTKPGKNRDTRRYTDPPYPKSPEFTTAASTR